MLRSFLKIERVPFCPVDFPLRFDLPYPRLHDFQLDLFILDGPRPLSARLRRKPRLSRPGGRFTNDFVQPPAFKEEFSILVIGVGLVPRHARSLSICSRRAAMPAVS